jgi:hypothetical protein
MSQEYSSTERADDPHALPDVEVYEVTQADIDSGDWGDLEMTEPGFYWWSCFPGCLPDGDPVGPFASYEEALADAQDNGE